MKNLWQRVKIKIRIYDNEWNTITIDSIIVNTANRKIPLLVAKGAYNLTKRMIRTYNAEIKKKKKDNGSRSQRDNKKEKEAES